MAERRRLIGLAVSPGVALGSAFCLHSIPPIPSTDRLNEAHVMSELAAFEAAVQSTRADLESLQSNVRAHVGDDEAAIFRSQIAILHDVTLLDKVRRFVSEHQASAARALRETLAEYKSLFAKVQDEYLRERFTDLRDVLERLERHLARTEPRVRTPEGPAILISDELLPSDVVAVSEEQVMAIVTQGGGRTSHAAILARSYGIPAVAGVAGLLSQVNNADSLIVDGTAGLVFVNPDEETLRAYRKLRREYLNLKKSLFAKSIGPATTADGQRVHLMANVSCAADATESQRVGADGVGLFRTEFFFLTRPKLPSEDEQVEAYRKVIAVSPQGPVTIRTLDLGGDKTIPYLTHAPEANPFMGWRSIRLSFEHPEIFSTQIRAILRAAYEASRQIRMLFPMITTWDELVRVHELVDLARGCLSKSEIPFGEVQIGMMLEVPAAAVMLDHLVELVDFVSVGSNDLVQYLTAADRDNPKVSHLCQALSPAVLRVLARAVDTCREARIPISVCGEMAGSPRAFPLLLGMGLRSFSMSPSFVPAIHALARHVSVASSQQILEQASKLKTSKEIHCLLDDYVKRVCPDVSPLLIA